MAILSFLFALHTDAWGQNYTDPLGYWNFDDPQIDDDFSDLNNWNVYSQQGTSITPETRLELHLDGGATAPAAINVSSKNSLSGNFSVQYDINLYNHGHSSTDHMFYEALNGALYNADVYFYSDGSVRYFNNNGGWTSKGTLTGVDITNTKLKMTRTDSSFTAQVWKNNAWVNLYQTSTDFGTSAIQLCPGVHYNNSFTKPITAYIDNLSGTINENFENLNNWNIGTHAQGTAKAESSAELFIQNGISYGSTTMQNKAPLAGDFDLQYDLNINNHGLSSYDHMAVEGIEGALYSPEIYFYANGTVSYFNNKGSWISKGNQTVDITDTKLRLIRSGNQFTAKVWKSDTKTWVDLYTTSTDFGTSDVYLASRVHHNANYDKAITSNISSLIVTQGEQAKSQSNSVHGNIDGATWTQGKIGNALSFDGINDSVDIAMNQILNLSGKQNITMAGWINASDLAGTGAYNNIVSYEGGTAALMLTENGKVGYWLQDQNGNWHCVITDQAVITKGSWYYVVGVYDGDRQRIYINGIEAKMGNSDSFILYNTNQPFHIGYTTDALPRAFKGSIDEVSVWDQALDSYQIDSIYKAGMATFKNIVTSVNNDWSLMYDSQQINQLSNLYVSQTGSLQIGNVLWSYTNESMPGDIGNNWMEDNTYYIKLGSGLEGVIIPEPCSWILCCVALLYIGIRKSRRR